MFKMSENKSLSCHGAKISLVSNGSRSTPFFLGRQIRALHSRIKWVICKCDGVICKCDGVIYTQKVAAQKIKAKLKNQAPMLEIPFHLFFYIAPHQKKIKSQGSKAKLRKERGIWEEHMA